MAEYCVLCKMELQLSRAREGRSVLMGSPYTSLLFT